MRRIAFLTVTFILSYSNGVFGLPLCTVFSKQAQGINGPTITLQVGPGHGLNTNFIPTREQVTNAWIDDLSRITLSSDGNLCQRKGDQQQDCTSVSATVLHLKQIELIDFPNLPRSRDGSTLLTAITEGEEGRKLYQFRVVPVSNEPKCKSITILPDPERLTPVLDQTPTITSSTGWHAEANVLSRRPNPAQASSEASVTPSPITSSVQLETAPTPTPEQLPSPTLDSSTTLKQPSANVSKLPLRVRSKRPLVAATSSTQTAEYSAQAVNDANAAAFGLGEARRKGQINPNTTTWKKVQGAIRQLRLGKSRKEAAGLAKIPISVLVQLITWGQQRP